MASISSRYSRFRTLSRQQQGMLLVATVYLPFFWLGLRALGLSRLQVFLLRWPHASKPTSTTSKAEVQALGEAVNIAARHTLGPRSCLTRSLLLGWLLRRRGVQSQLRIGVRLTNGRLDAHAWVECEGVPVNDQPDVSTRFASFGDLVPLEAFHTP
jgi:hypothetical protein